jgi:hypothetical protein
MATTFSSLIQKEGNIKINFWWYNGRNFFKTRNESNHWSKNIRPKKDKYEMPSGSGDLHFRWNKADLGKYNFCSL